MARTTVNDPRPDDVADHVSGNLDPRRVSRVKDGQVWLWLWLGSGEIGPFPAENYTFTRET